MNNPVVSVIVPVYNVAAFLPEALESVVHQTYKNLEILLINDGSTDGSGEICDAYADRDVRITVIHQENRGLSAARNIGLDRMSGEFVAFFDSDDALDEEFIEKQLSVILETGADLTVCKYTIHETAELLKRGCEEKVPPSASGIYDHDKALYALADGAIDVSAWNKLYRKELWRNIRYPDGYVYEDMDTTFRIFDLCNTIYVLDEPLYMHRNHPGSITKTISVKHINDRKRAASHFADFIDGYRPGVFSKRHARQWRQCTIEMMIVNYLSCFVKKEWAADISCEELRNQIIKAGRESGIDTLRFRRRIIWDIIRFCPWLLDVVYPFYRSLRFSK